MRVIRARNVHQAFPKALQLLSEEAIFSTSRNGPVSVMPEPVATVYERPEEHVMFWPQRDANPFFHLYESLWMLAGRDDVEGPARYAKNILNYSDDGKILHGAYGNRWRNALTLDQLKIIAERLKNDPSDRRSVLQMWDANLDLATDDDWDHIQSHIQGTIPKDLPCNLIATFQIVSDKLNLTVFCRSNDIVWGCYGSDFVNFSTLQEYMALWIGVPIGTYTQVSVNWHAYLNNIVSYNSNLASYGEGCPYSSGDVNNLPIKGSIEELEKLIPDLLFDLDNGNLRMLSSRNEWIDMCYQVLHAHEIYTNEEAPEKFHRSLDLLKDRNYFVDWVVAAREWIERKYVKWLSKEKHRRKN